MASERGEWQAAFACVLECSNQLFFSSSSEAVMINHSMGNSISYTNACTACFLYHLIDLKERDCSLSTCRMMIDGFDLATIIADSFLIFAAST